MCVRGLSRDAEDGWEPICARETECACKVNKTTDNPHYTPFLPQWCSSPEPLSDTLTLQQHVWAVGGGRDRDIDILKYRETHR